MILVVWKVKEVKEFLEDKHDEDIMQFFTFDYDSEGYTSLTRIGRLDVRKPKRTEFEHQECKNCQMVTINSSNRCYCSKNDELLKIYDVSSCEDFQHNSYELEYIE